MIVMIYVVSWQDHDGQYMVKGLRCPLQAEQLRLCLEDYRLDVEPVREIKEGLWESYLYLMSAGP